MSPRMKRRTCRESRPRHRLIGTGLRARFCMRRRRTGFESAVEIREYLGIRICKYYLMELIGPCTELHDWLYV